MHDPVLSMERFTLLKLSIDGSPDRIGRVQPGQLSLQCQTAWATEEPQRGSLTLTVTLSPKSKQGQNPLDVEASIVGFFKMADACQPQDREYALMLNGAFILYGILRGLLAGMCGAFVSGQVILPALDMKGIIDDMLHKRKLQVTAEAVRGKPAQPATKRQEKKTRQA